MRLYARPINLMDGLAMTVLTTLNLVTATGVAYALLGAVIMFVCNRELCRNASRIVAGYPGVLAILSTRRRDARCGLMLVTAGIALQALGVYGYTAPASLWRYPAFALAAFLLIHCVRRFNASRRIPVSRRAGSRELFQTRRSMRLREAAQREAANLHAREAARGPRDNGIVYLVHEWEPRWWSDRFGVSIDVLRSALHHVGPMVVDVERFLALQRSTREHAAA
jgi:hypothetical protein